MTHTHRARLAARSAAVLGLLAGLLGVTTSLSAADFWVIPNAFQLAEGSTLELRGQTSSLFPTSKAAVGRGGPRAFERIAGHPLEFVPLRDPASLRIGDTLSVRVLLLGKPLVGAGMWNVRGIHDSAAVAAVVHRYDAALASGDSATALALLAPDAVVLESGGVESRAEYRSHHLPADMAYARAVKSVRSPVHVVIEGNAAWASSTSVSQGEYRGKAVNSAGSELMVLTRGADGAWRIRAIHWSSRARRQP